MRRVWGSREGPGCPREGGTQVKARPPEEGSHVAGVCSEGAATGIRDQATPGTFCPLWRLTPPWACGQRVPHPGQPDSQRRVWFPRPGVDIVHGGACWAHRLPCRAEAEGGRWGAGRGRRKGKEVSVQSCLQGPDTGVSVLLVPKKTTSKVALPLRWECRRKAEAVTPGQPGDGMWRGGQLPGLRECRCSLEAP